MPGNKSTSVPKEAVQDVAVPSTPLAESDVTLDESLRSLPAVDASERPFGPLNRTAPAAIETTAATDDSSAPSTPFGTPSKKVEVKGRASSLRTSGEVASRTESDVTIPSDTTGTVADASASIDEGRRVSSPVRSEEGGRRANGSLNGESSGSIPFDSTGDFAEIRESTASASALKTSTAPSTPASTAEASIGTLPSTSTGGLEASVLSSPPATPETSAQAAVRTLREELRGVTPSKQLKVDREYMDLENSPMSIVLERTEPSLQAGNIDEPSWHRDQALRSSDESMDESDPKPKASKRRLPTDAVANDKSKPRRQPVQARRSHRSTASSGSSKSSKSSQNGKKAHRQVHDCPHCRCHHAKSSRASSAASSEVAVDEIREVMRYFNDYFNEDEPVDAAEVEAVAEEVESVAPALDTLSSDESSIEDPLADMVSDDEVPAEPPVPICPRCGRNCKCVPVQIPEEAENVKVPRPRRRREPKMSLEDAWKALEFIDDFEMVDLPAAPPKFDDNFNLLEFEPLTTDRLKKYGFSDDFQVGLYEDGEVVFQGSFPGVNTTTELLRRATYQPVLAYHVPEDPVVDIEVGDDFFVMITKAGHLLSLGANDEGQLGATANPSRYRQRAATPASMRRFPKLKDGHVGDVVFREITVVGKTTWATDENGFTYICGEGFEPVLTIWCRDQTRDLICWTISYQFGVSMAQVRSYESKLMGIMHVFGLKVAKRHESQWQVSPNLRDSSHSTLAALGSRTFSSLRINTGSNTSRANIRHRRQSTVQMPAQHHSNIRMSEKTRIFKLAPH
uniref:Histone acetyltransferase GCN5 n=1 Tax=Panagrellus redivivus TaxID=6233 RepID=A0A7E4VAY9_PANRE